MKKGTKKLLALILSVIMIFSVIPFAVSASEGKPLSEYSVGDIIEFGSYPQSEVKDEALIAQLNAVDSEWISYNYMSGAGTSWGDGSAKPSDYMRYKDVTLNSAKYRAVTFDTYRKYYTSYKSDTSTDYTDQADNGYYINTIYWFKYEPLAWRVLDPATGLVLSESIIDSQAYCDTSSFRNSNYYKSSTDSTYANNYAESTIRAWLNDNFYNTAFSSADGGKITTATLENKAYSTSYSCYDSATTYDKVFILTHADMANTEYGFNSSTGNSDINRRASGTDYAKAQGLYVNTSYTTSDGRPTSYWRLRSAGNYSNDACGVSHDGSVCNNYYVYHTYTGIRPALILNPEASFNTYCKNGHQNAKTISAKVPTCTEEGYTGDTYCEDCGRIIENGETIKMLPHTDKNDDGWCDNCNAELRSHEPVTPPTKPCTCKCHSSGFSLFIWKIGNFFHKIFKMDKYYECACGEKHW